MHLMAQPFSDFYFNLNCDLMFYFSLVGIINYIQVDGASTFVRDAMLNTALLPSMFSRPNITSHL